MHVGVYQVGPRLYLPGQNTSSNRDQIEQLSLSDQTRLMRQLSTNCRFENHRDEATVNYLNETHNFSLFNDLYYGERRGGGDWGGGDAILIHPLTLRDNR